MFIRASVPVLLGVGVIIALLTATFTLVWAWFALVCALVLLDVLLAPAITSLDVQRSLPTSIRVGTDVTVGYEFTNTNRRRLRE